MRLREFLSTLRGAVVVTSHVNTDPDGLACAYLMARLVEEVGLEAHLCFPGGISSVSKTILVRLGMSWQRECPEDARTFILCDFSNPSQLRELAERFSDPSVTLVVVDHHFPEGKLVPLAKLAVVEREPASAVIAARILMDEGVNVCATLATLGIAGILYDTKKLLFASSNTFRVLSWLLDSGGDYRLAHSLLVEEEPRSEKLAKLKGLLRASVFEVCGYIVAFTEVSANEANVARLLVSAGADLAVVVGGKKESRLSIRVSDEMQKAGIDAGEIAQSVASALGAEGGGHAGAAGVKTTDRKAHGRMSRAIVNEVIERLFRHLCTQRSGVR